MNKVMIAVVGLYFSGSALAELKPFELDISDQLLASTIEKHELADPAWLQDQSLTVDESKSIAYRNDEGKQCYSFTFKGEPAEQSSKIPVITQVICGSTTHTKSKIWNGPVIY